MVIRWRAGTASRSDSPFVSFDEDTVTVIGDDTRVTRSYLAVIDDEVVIGHDLGAVVAELGGGRERVDPVALSNILVHGFVIIPETVYRPVLQLDMGDVAIVARRDGRLQCELRPGHAFCNERSRQDEEPSEDRLFALLAEAVDRTVRRAGGSGHLMLSAGVDSMSLALALAAGGYRDVICTTSRSGPDDREWEYAAAMCRKLGLRHEVLDPPSPEVSRPLLEHIFTESAEPAGEALFQYGHAVSRVVADGHRWIMDGTGNDHYMGYGPGGTMRWKLRLRARNRTVAGLLAQIIPMHSPLNYLLRSRLATTFPLRLLRDHEAAVVYRDAVPAQAAMWDRSTEREHLDDWDLMNSVRRGSMTKVRIAATAFGLEPLFPNSDRDLADYCFNLPEAERFDRKTGRRKVLLRRMLASRLGYDEKVAGKNPFHIDRVRFLQENRSFVLDEIASCSLWTGQALPMATAWIDDLGKRPMLSHALIPLFQISGWHNHSTYLTGIDGGGR